MYIGLKSFIEVYWLLHQWIAISFKLTFVRFSYVFKLLQIMARWKKWMVRTSPGSEYRLAFFINELPIKIAQWTRLRSIFWISRIFPFIIIMNWVNFNLKIVYYFFSIKSISFILEKCFFPQRFTSATFIWFGWEFSLFICIRKRWKWNLLLGTKCMNGHS